MKVLGLVVSDKKIFENCILKTYFFDPVTYLCNQLERFEQIWKGTTQGSFLWSLVKIQIRGDVVKRNCWRTHARMEDIEGSQKLTEHEGELKMVNSIFYFLH